MSAPTLTPESEHNAVCRQCGRRTRPDSIATGMGPCPDCPPLQYVAIVQEVDFEGYPTGNPRRVIGPSEDHLDLTRRTADVKGYVSILPMEPLR